MKVRARPEFSHNHTVHTNSSSLPIPRRRRAGARGSMSTAAFSALVALQALTRVVTFVLGALLARSLGPKWYAIANVNFQLVTSSALFLSKEGLRRACQRVYPGGDGPALTFCVNLAWLSVPVSLLSAAVVSHYAISHSGASEDDMVEPSEYASVILLMCAAAVIEAAADPGWVYAQSNDLIGRRVVAEGVALVVKAIATAWLALHLTMGARAFGYAQLLYSAVYSALVYALLLHHRRDAMHLLLPRRDQPPEGGSSWLPPSHRLVAGQICWQAVQKYVLTEGERLVLVWLAPLAQQVVPCARPYARAHVCVHARAHARSGPDLRAEALARPPCRLLPPTGFSLLSPTPPTLAHAS